MHEYIIKRLLLIVPTLVGCSLLVFFVMKIVPADYVDAAFAAELSGTPAERQETLARLRAEVGLDKPAIVQYWRWVSGFFTGNCAESLMLQRSVCTILKERVVPTAEIAIGSIVILVSWAVPVGVLSAVRQNSFADYAARVLSISLLSIPAFWLAILVLLALLVFTGTGPPLQYVHIWDDPLANLSKMIWPILVLALHEGAPIARITRSQMLEVIRADYIRTAHAKGLGERAVLLRHALRNTLIPVLTFSGWRLAGLLGGTVIVEFVFNVPGIGSAIYLAIGARDYIMLGSLVLFITLIFLVLNLVVDVLYSVIDPRIRYGSAA